MLNVARHIAFIDPDLVRETKGFNRTYKIQAMGTALDTALDIDHAFESAGSPGKKRFNR